MIRNVTVFIVLASIFFSCEKHEGTGGLNTIEGYVYMQHLNPLMEKVGSPYPAKEEAVYIIYGSEKYVGDRERTNHKGFFSFPYLMAGDYLVYAYSKDTSAFNKREEIAMEHFVKLRKKKETVSLDTIIIYRYMDYDDGHATVYGQVFERSFFSSGFVRDTIFAQNKEVFIVLLGDDGIHDRIRTSYDGTFRIENVLPGSYYIYALGEQPQSKEKVPVGDTIVIEESATSIRLNPFYIDNY